MEPERINSDEKSRYYTDLREFMEALDKNGKLARIKREVVKERDISPYFWLQFRGLPEKEWKSFLFEKVIDAKGRRHDRVLMGPYSASREIVALGMKCRVEEMNERWSYALSHPIDPVMVKSGPVQELVHRGKELEEVGLEGLAFPVEVPGFSGSIRTSTHMVSKDPDTGARNVGSYSGHISGRKNFAWGTAPHHHGYGHIIGSRQRGKRAEVAVIIGATPNIALMAAASVPYSTDEYAAAGSLAGEPVRLVKCKTVDLEVPATAEIVIEGLVSNEYMVQQLISHGDYAGYMRGPEGGSSRQLVDVTCITHRQNPINTAGVYGFGPTDAGMMTAVVKEMTLYNYLNNSYSPRVLDVCCSLYGGSGAYTVVKIKKVDPWDPWQILHSLVGYEARVPKIAIVVDEDIDCRDPNAVNWALSFSMQPNRDIRIVNNRVPDLDPSATPPGTPQKERRYPSPSGTSAILIDATRKWAYHPVALPKEEYMRHALKLWEAEGFPKLDLRTPWYGYHLGAWGASEEENAQLMLSGDMALQGENQKKHNLVKIKEVSD